MEVVDIQTSRNAIITFILNSCASKLPFRGIEILEILHQDKEMFNHCFPAASKALQQTYGIVVEKVPKSKGGKGGQFICFSEISAKSPLEYTDGQRQHLTLLFVILSYIFMKGCQVDGTQLEKFLAGLKIYYNEEHSYFGTNVKKLVTETFVKQLYLKQEKSKSEFDTGTKYLYSWGFRSEVEFDKKLVLEATAKILGKPVEMFEEQYNEAYRSDEDEDANEGEGE